MNADRARDQTLQDRRALEPRGETAVLLEAVGLLSGALDFGEVLRRLTELFRTRLSVDAVQLWLREGAAEEFRLAAVAGGLDAPDQRTPAPIQGLLCRVVAHAEPLVVADLASATSPEEREWAQAECVTSLLGTSLVLEGEPVGVVLLLSRQPCAFAQQPRVLVRALATAAAVAIRNGRLHEDEIRRAAQAEGLAEIARVVSSARSAKEALREVCQRAAVLCGAERGTIYFWDQQAARLMPAMSQYANGKPNATQAGRFKSLRGRSPKESAFIRHLIETRQPAMLEDAAASPLGTPEWVKWFGFRSLLGAPLLVDGQAVGALFLDHACVRPFTPSQADLARAIADQVAFAVQKALLLEETEKRLRQTEAHLEIARTLSSTLELEPLLMQIARQAARACEMDRCCIYLWEGERVVPVMAQYADGRADPALWKAFKGMGRMRVEEIPFFAETVRRREPVVLDRPAENPMVPRTMDVFQIKAVLAVPLIRQERVVGAMTLDNTDRDQAVTHSQITLATTIASQVALAVDNGRLYDETQRRLRETGALLSVAQTLGGSLDAQEIARRTAREVTRLLGADTSIFYGVDETNEYSFGVAGYHVPESLRNPDFSMPLRHSLPPYLAQAQETGRPVTSSNVAADPRFDHPVIRDMAIAPRALLFAPVLSHGRYLGSLISYWWNEARDFTQEEVDLAAGVAAQMAPVLENARLYTQAQRAFADLKATQERLVQSEKFRAMAEMAGGVAHDFNNLLAAILGRTQYLLLRLQKGTVAPPEAEKDLAVIEQAALDGAETVRRLLEFTRAMPVPSGTASVDVNGLLSYTAEVSRHRWKDEAEAKGLQIQMVIDPGHVSAVAGSAAELREVLLNLVLNAIDAMPEGGSLTLSSRAEKDWVCLRVRDTGMGMPEDVRRRVFDPFFTTKGPRSSGLGLSASYGIVRSHGGEIEVESAPGRGTTFTVRLPAARTSVVPERKAEANPATRSLRVLVIDDEEPVRGLLRDLLTEAGHEVWQAASGSDGLALLETQPVDLVITDLGMPGMTGWEVAERVKARWPERKVALITGWGTRVKPEEMRAHGVDLLFSKPFQIDDILAIKV